MSPDLAVLLAEIAALLVLAARGAVIARRWRRRHAARASRPAPGRPVDGDALTPREEDQLAVAQFLLTRYPLVQEPGRSPREKGHEHDDQQH
jgi:hypothetical protein